MSVASVILTEDEFCAEVRSLLLAMRSVGPAFAEIAHQYHRPVVRTPTASTPSHAHSRGPVRVYRHNPYAFDLLGSSAYYSQPRAHRALTYVPPPPATVDDSSLLVFRGSVSSVRLQQMAQERFRASYHAHVTAGAFQGRWHHFVQHRAGLRCYIYTAEDYRTYPTLHCHISETELRCCLHAPITVDTTAWCDAVMGAHLHDSRLNLPALVRSCCQLAKHVVQCAQSESGPEAGWARSVAPKLLSSVGTCSSAAATAAPPALDEPQRPMRLCHLGGEMAHVAALHDTLLLQVSISRLRRSFMWALTWMCAFSCTAERWQLLSTMSGIRPPQKQRRGSSAAVAPAEAGDSEAVPPFSSASSGKADPSANHAVDELMVLDEPRLRLLLTWIVESAAS